MDETIHIAIPSNDTYWFYAAVAAASACRGSARDVKVHLIDGGVSAEHWERFRRIVPAECSRHGFDIGRFPDWHGSGITWSRLFLPELLKEESWVVSADADVMFRGDVSRLWDLRDEEVEALPSRDSPLPGHRWNDEAIDWYAENGLSFKCPEEYFCAGLTLLNLARMRSCNWGERRDVFLGKFDAASMPNADQCVLNWLLKDRKRLLPRQWGAFSGDANADVDWDEPGAVHFVDDMPWRRNKPTRFASDLVREWWDLAESLDAEAARRAHGYRGCNNRLEYGLRLLAFRFFKNNQWILSLHPSLRLHLRGTRGIV